MIGIVVVGHLKVAEALVQTAFSIVGRREQVEYVGFFEDESERSFAQRVREAVKSVDRGKGVLLVCDLFGGSCAFIVGKLYAKREDIKIVCGANLAMLLKLFTYTGPSLEKAATEAIEAAKRGAALLQV